jgi:hypothetical protein
MNDSPLNPDPLLDPLFARARAMRPDTARAEYAFETRLGARLSSTSPQPSSDLGRLAWKLLPFFALVVLGLGALQMELGSQSREASEAASLQNPETVDLFSSFD